MARFMKEFRDFAFKGNVINLAVGVIIGAAFQGIIASLNENILSPVLGLLIRQDFASLQWDVAGVTLKYGAFITSVINFVLMAFVVFLIVRLMNRAASGKNKESAAPVTKQCKFCLSEINIGAVRCPACTSDLE